MPLPRFELISHALCPYVQRAAIVLTEKGVPFTRTDIDLSAKPDWFLALSPTGKVPLLRIDERDVLFESSVIAEYIDEVTPGSLHPSDPLAKAKNRSWMEFASAVLGDIAGLYGASDAAGFEAKRAALAERFARVEAALQGPWFDGDRFGMVDAAFGPVFRYFGIIEPAVVLGLFEPLPRVRAWRDALARRPSVAGAVRADYGDRLMAFLKARRSHLSGLLESAA
jgi:glutathione S-transferase